MRLLMHAIGERQPGSGAHWLIDPCPKYQSLTGQSDIHRLATFRQSRILERIGLCPLESYVEADLKWRNMVRNIGGMYPM